MSQPQTFQTVTLSTKWRKNIQKLAFPNGAILFCVCGCGYSKEKTPEKMNEYLSGWPKMHGFPAGVKPK